MKLQLVKPSAAATIGLLLTAPALYFIFVSVLKYAFGLPALFDGFEPLLNAMGVKQNLGWNINLLFVLGPLLAFLLNISSIVTVGWQKTSDGIDIQFSLQNKPLNWVVIGISGGLLLLLFLYALGENCNC